MAGSSSRGTRLAGQLIGQPIDRGRLSLIDGADFGRRRGDGVAVGRPDPALTFQPIGGQGIDVGHRTRGYPILFNQARQGLLRRDPAFARGRSGGSRQPRRFNFSGSEL
jgi:hypothetical protein